MDPGTAIGIASLAYDVTRDLYDYYRAWKDCESDVTELREQLLWLHQAFRVAREQARRPDLSPQSTDLLYAALGACNEAANELRDILDKIRKVGSPKSTWEKLKAQGRKACYPFRKATVTSIKANLSDCRDELQLAASLLQLDASSLTQSKLYEIDNRLVDGFAAVDDALGALPTIASAVVATEFRVRSMEEDTETVKDLMQKSEDRQVTRNILDWFCTAEYGQQLHDFYSRRQEGTGTWFLDSPEYNAWSQASSSTLICPGHPGAGKTIMAATVIRELLHQSDLGSVGIAYVFCSYQRREEQDLAHILGALIRQLLQLKGNLPESIVEAYAEFERTKKRPTRADLETFLFGLVDGYSKVYIVIDALDECQQDARAGLAQLVRRRQAACNLNVLMTTRPLPDILDQFVHHPRLTISASNSDVEMYLTARLDGLSKRVREDRELQKQIVAAIVSAVNGMFLLAQLHMDSLKEKRTLKSIKTSLATLPRGSDPTVFATVYTDAMERIISQPQADAALAKEALSWVVRSRRPISSLELQHALAIETDDLTSRFDEENVLPMDEVISLCAGLITEDESSGVVRLVHYTTQRFFEDNWATWFPSADSIIALKCVRYLLLRPFPSALRGQTLPRGRISRSVRDAYADPLLQYAAIHWAAHSLAAADAEGAAGQSHVIDLALRFVEDGAAVKSVLQSLWILSGDRGDSHTFRREYFAHVEDRSRILGLFWNRKFGLTSPNLVARLASNATSTEDLQLLTDLFLEALLSEQSSANSRCSTGLYRAASAGLRVVVEVLAGTERIDLDTEYQDKDGRTALSQAAWRGDVEVARLLLGIDQTCVEHQDGKGNTPLLLAAANRQRAMVELLLQSGKARVNVHNNVGLTPLIFASENGHASLSRVLLNTRGVEVDAKDNQGRTALSYAAWTGHAAVVRQLLATGQVEPDTRDHTEETPLSYATRAFRSTATEQNRRDVLKMLLDTGRVDVNSSNARGVTPMMYAAEKGRELMVQLLFDTGEVDPSARDVQLRTALHYAAWGGSVTAVRLLLCADEAAAGLQDEDGCTPLSLAIQACSWDAREDVRVGIVKLLADTPQGNADLADSKHQRTPFSYAAGAGQDAAMRVLLETDNPPHPDSRDVAGRSPLSHASEQGHEAAVSLLLSPELNVDPDGRDHGLRTPLMYAIRSMRSGVVKLLLERGRVDTSFGHQAEGGVGDSLCGVSPSVLK